MLHSTRGIVFHQVKYSETSIIAKIYTEQFGLKSYLFRGARKKKSNTQAALLQHLNLLELEVYQREKKEIQQVKEIKMAYPFKTIPYDIRKSSILIFLNEILYQVIREEEPNPDLFQFLYQAIQLLDNKEKNLASFHFIFLIQLTRFLGFFPRNNYSDTHHTFNLSEGEFSSMSLPGNYFAPSPYGRLLSQIMELQPDASYSIPSPVRNSLLEIILNYYKLHVPGMKDIKSLDVLKSIFD